MELIDRYYRFLGKVASIPFRRRANRYLALTNDCQKVQHEILKRVLELNKSTDFSRDHGLNQVQTVRDFRNAVPVYSYEDLSSYIERVKEGKTSALLGENNKLLMFSLSSGTTAASKYIPITRPFFEDYRRGWKIWGIRMLDDSKSLYGGHILQLTSDYEKYCTPQGVPCGSISGMVAKMQHPLIRKMYDVPLAVMKIGDYETRSYAVLRMTLMSRWLRILSTANPSTLVQLAHFGNQHAEELIRDLYDGTFCSRFPLSPEIYRQLQSRISVRHPRTARQLERILENTGTLYPRDYWPTTILAAVWTGGSARAYLPSLKALYGEHLIIRDHGLHASEGRMTIPLSNETSAGVLDLGSHFFEFIPEESYHSDRPEVLEAHELEEGRNYYVLLTTTSGLYRYDICDVVRCTGFYNTTPMLEFLHKGAHISSVTGEKLGESQVVNAVGDTLRSMNLLVNHFTLAPHWEEPPRYELLIESDQIPDETLRNAVAREADQRLQQLNMEYQEKRQSFRLGEIRCRLLPPGTWEQFGKQRRAKTGGSSEQYKHPCLSPQLDFAEKVLFPDRTSSPVGS